MTFLAKSTQTVRTVFIYFVKPIAIQSEVGGFHKLDLQLPDFRINQSIIFPVGLTGGCNTNIKPIRCGFVIQRFSRLLVLLLCDFIDLLNLLPVPIANAFQLKRHLCHSRFWFCGGTVHHCEPDH